RRRRRAALVPRPGGGGRAFAVERGEGDVVGMFLPAVQGQRGGEREAERCPGGQRDRPAMLRLRDGEQVAEFVIRNRVDGDRVSDHRRVGDGERGGHRRAACRNGGRPSLHHGDFRRNGG